jgi:hypothetical protein
MRYLHHAKYLSLLRRRPNEMAYFGWTGYGNVGDEVLFAVAQDALDQCTLRSWPEGPVAERLLRARRGLFGAALLGGGTLIGTPRIRQALATVVTHQPNAPLFMVGPGVEDPELAAAGSGLPIADELARWIPLLSEFERVTVRGPRSQSILADLGVASTVVGDPVLLLRNTEVAAPKDERILGVNLLSVGRIFGGHAQQVASQIADCCRRLAAEGWHIRLIPLWERDVELHQAVCDTIGAGAEVITASHDVDELKRAFASCRVMVGTKLHSVVLAAAMNVPAISIAYAPKCIDFQASVDQTDLVIRTDRVDADTLHELVVQIDTELSVRRARLAAAVTGLRERLTEEYRHVALTMAERSPGRARTVGSFSS